MTNESITLTGCINCGQCNVCPTGVDIASCLTIYDGSIKSGNKEAARKDYESLIKFMRAHNCIACGRCLKKCPVEIDIIERLKHVTDYFKVD